jgi:hypothetical protein
MARKMAPFIPLRQDNYFSCLHQELRFSKHPRLVQKTAAQMELITMLGSTNCPQMPRKMAPFIPLRKDNYFSCPTARLALSNHPRLVQKTAAQMELIKILFAWFKKLPTDGAQNGILIFP